MQSVDGDVRLSVRLDTRSVSKNISNLNKDFQKVFSGLNKVKGLDSVNNQITSLEENIKSATSRISEIKNRMSEIKDNKISEIFDNTKVSNALADVTDKIEILEEQLEQTGTFNISKQISIASEMSRLAKQYEEASNLAKQLGASNAEASEEYKELENELTSLQKSIESDTASLQGLQQSENLAQQQAQVLSQALSNINNLDEGSANILKQLIADVNQSLTKISELQTKLDTLNEPKPTEVLTSLQSDIKNTSDYLQTATARAEELRNMIAQSDDASTTANLVSDLKFFENEIEQTSIKLKALEEAEQELKDTGKAYITGDPQQIEQTRAALEQATSQYNSAIDKVAQFNQAQAKAAAVDNFKQKFSGIVSIVKSVMSKAGSYLKSFASVAKSAFSKVANLAKSAFSKITSHAKNSSKNASGAISNINGAVRKGVKNLLRYGLGIRGTFMLFRKLRNAVKDGMQNLAQYSDEVNGDISGIMSAFTKLKNALATMFQPLLSAVSPILTSIINKASRVATSIGKLIAAFTGQDYVYEAVDVQQDYAKSLDKTSKSATKAKKALEAYTSPLDDINKFQESQTDSDTSVEDGGTVDPSKMFKISAVESKFKDLAKKIKDILGSTDWTSLGTMLGQKLNDVLGNIDWASIQQKAKDFATRLYTLINGFVKSVDWTLVGKTIAEGIKTDLIFLVTFIEGLDWSAIGKAFGNIINGLADPENAKLFARVIVGVITGGLTLVTSMLSAVNWAKVSDMIIAFITNFDFKKISDAVIRFLNSFATALSQIKFDEIGEAFRNGISKINWGGIWDGVVNVATNALKGLGKLFNIDLDTSKLNNAFKDLKEPIGKLLDSFKSLAQKILPVIVEKLLPAAVDLIGNIVSALSPIIDALAPAISAILEAVSKIFEAIGPVLPVLGNTIGKLVEMLTPFIEKVVNIIAQIVEKLAPVLGVIFDVLGDIFEILTPVFDLLGESLEPILDILGGIIDVIGGIFKAIKGLLNGDIDEVTAGVKQMFEGIVNFLKGIVRSIFESLTKPFQMAWETIKGIWSKVSDFFSGIFSDAWQGIKNVWSSVTGYFKFVWDSIVNVFKVVGQWFSDRFSQAWQGIVNIWKNVGNFFRNIWAGIVNVFQGVGGWFRGIFDKAVSGIKNAFNGVKQWFANLWQGIWNVIKTPINWIINGINALIGGLNNVKIDVPDWVPVIGGKRFGFDIPEIPHLATGAVIPPNKEFLAVLGDQKQGTNIEAPANLIRQIVREEMQNSSTGNKYEIPLVVGRQTLYKLIIDEAKLKMAQTGANPFELITV